MGGARGGAVQTAGRPSTRRSPSPPQQGKSKFERERDPVSHHRAGEGAEEEPPPPAGWGGADSRGGCCVSPPRGGWFVSVSLTKAHTPRPGSSPRRERHRCEPT